MEYISAKEVAKKWKIGVRRIQYYCANNKIPGVKYMGKQWIIPIDATKPVDSRKKDSNKNYSVNHYHFPIFIYSDLYASNSNATDIEMLLLKAQLYHLMGQYSKCSNLCKYILKNTSDTYLCFGANAFLYFNASLSGNIQESKSYLNALKELQSEDKQHSEDYKLIIEVFSCFSGNKTNKLLSINCNKLSHEALHYYECFIYFVDFLCENEPKETTYLHEQIFEKRLKTLGLEPICLMMNSVLSVHAYYLKNETSAESYLENALEIAINNNWLYHFCKFYQFKKEIYKEILNKNHPEMIDIIERISNQEFLSSNKEKY